MRRNCGVQRALQGALLGALLGTGAAASEAQAPVKQVLILQSLDRGNLSLDHFTAEFRVSLDQHAGHPVNVVQVVVGPTGFVSASEQSVVHYIRSIYAERTAPDLVLTIGGPAAAFARRHRSELFAATPLLFGSVDQRWLADAPLGKNEAAVTVANDFPRLIDDILRVLPETKHVFMVIGAGPIGRFWHRELDAEFSRFRDRLTFIWSDDLSLPEIRRRVAGLPTHSAIVYLTFSTDAQGGAYSDEQVLSELHDHANAPVFGAQSPLLGHGIVGGFLVPVGDAARRTADVASRILNGEPTEQLRTLAPLASRPMFDWRELERWRVPESRLPSGSVLMYRGPTLWSEHKVAVLTAIGALAMQSFLIALLMYERRSRQRAEFESRRNLALASDANRRESISALTSSISHELSQPLSAIAVNAHALGLMVERNMTMTTDEGLKILRDINGQAVLASQIIERHRAMLRGHELQKKQIDLSLVIDDALALVGHYMRTQEIQVRLELSEAPCVVDGDRVLLSQVLVNLIRNATDALAETPVANRCLTIQTAVTTADAQISVIDTGSGLAEDVVDRLFTPFVTTKAQGLGIGLTVAQRIVEAHAGTITCAANIKRGATFTVTLPRKATTGLLSHSPKIGGETTVATLNQV